MNSQNNQPGQAAELRMRAEAIFRGKEAQSSHEIDLQWSMEKFAALSPEEIGQVLHELQVHQIELEMQNEELALAKRQAEAAADKYSELYEYTDGITGSAGSVL
jgi:hypothetical protein